MPVGTKGVYRRDPKTEEVNLVYWCATSGCSYTSLDIEDVKEHCVIEHDEPREVERAEENEEDEHSDEEEDIEGE